MSEPQFLVWSNQHERWWRPAQRGYTENIDVAGRYSRAEAEEIVAKSTLDGRLTRSWVDANTGVWYESLDEVMVLAPESIPFLRLVVDAGREP